MLRRGTLSPALPGKVAGLLTSPADDRTTVMRMVTLLIDMQLSKSFGEMLKLFLLVLQHLFHLLQL